MATLLQRLEQERADLRGELRGINDRCTAEDRQRTDDERARTSAILQRLQALEGEDGNGGEIAMERAAMKAIRREPSPAPSADNISIRDLAADNPNPWGPLIPNGASERVRDQYMQVGLGNYLHAVMQAGTPGGSVDPRLVRAEAPSGANVSVPSDAGFLTRTQYSGFLMNRAAEASQLLSLCTPIPVGEGFDEVEAPYLRETSRASGSRWGGVQVYRKGEADTVDPTKMKWGKWKLELEDLMGLAYATDRSLRDAVSLGAMFTTAFTSEFAFKVDDEIVRGSGAGEMLGIINAGCTVSQAKESGQAADTVVTKNLSNMWTRIPPRMRSRAIWLYNQELDAQFDELYVPAGMGAIEPRIITYNETGQVRIKGRPTLAIEQCSAPGDVGDIILAVMPEYAVITKGGIEAAESMHVRFIYNERTFRWVYRINGQPTWETYLTPYKGSATISPFVTLAAR